MDQYLSRIGYTGDKTPNLANLTRLVRCHLETVPFENLSFWHNPCQMPLDIPSLYDKVVTRRRGGVCCELNTIFCWLLKAMGYDAYNIMVRILMRPGDNPISHESCIVVLDGRKYYVDVGFGGPGPKGPVCLEIPEVQHVFGADFQVRPESVFFYIDAPSPEGFKPLLQLIDIPATGADFEVFFYFFTAHPEGHFVQMRTVNLCRPEGEYLALTGNTFTGLRSGEKIHQEIPEEEIPALLEQVFGLVL